MAGFTITYKRPVSHNTSTAPYCLVKRCIDDAYDNGAGALSTTLVLGSFQRMTEQTEWTITGDTLGQTFDWSVSGYTSFTFNLKKATNLTAPAFNTATTYYPGQMVSNASLLYVFIRNSSGSGTPSMATRIAAGEVINISGNVCYTILGVSGGTTYFGGYTTSPTGTIALTNGATPFATVGSVGIRYLSDITGGTAASAGTGTWELTTSYGEKDVLFEISIVNDALQGGEPGYSIGDYLLAPGFTASDTYRIASDSLGAPPNPEGASQGAFSASTTYAQGNSFTDSGAFYYVYKVGGSSNGGSSRSLATRIAAGEVAATTAWWTPTAFEDVEINIATTYSDPSAPRRFIDIVQEVQSRARITQCSRSTFDTDNNTKLVRKYINDVIDDINDNKSLDALTTRGYFYTVPGQNYVGVSIPNSSDGINEVKNLYYQGLPILPKTDVEFQMLKSATFISVPIQSTVFRAYRIAGRSNNALTVEFLDTPATRARVDFMAQMRAKNLTDPDDISPINSDILVWGALFKFRVDQGEDPAIDAATYQAKITGKQFQEDSNTQYVRA